jgi:hypothetical protein
MLMIIFGAGASYDSVPRDPASKQLFMGSHVRYFRPPLANDLFADRANFIDILDRYDACKPIVPLLHGIPEDKTIEDKLSELEAETKGNSRRRAQIVAIRFYMRDVLKECEFKWLQQHHHMTAYATLLDHLYNLKAFDDEVCFVTFNYDTMLEKALIWAKLMNYPPNVDEYIAHSTYKVFKLHGCVDWGRVPIEALPAGADAYKYFVENPDAKISENYALYGGVKLFPAIAIPLKGKGYECPAKHVEELKTCLPKVKKIITIGWKATEQHFLKDLSEGLELGYSLLVVSGSGAHAQTTHENLKRGIPSMNLGSFATLSGGGFTDLVKSKELEAFLKS